MRLVIQAGVRLRSPVERVELIYSGVEERYLGRLITSRRRFDSGPRNKLLLVF